MTRDEALNTITIMATAWPYPEWDEGRVELWCSALADEDPTDAQEVAVEAVRTREKAPSVKWFLEGLDAARRRNAPSGPLELEAPVASKDTALAGLAAARAALQTRNEGEPK